jgi:tRNA(fMet)-specific endonuclease VapC
LRISPPSRLNSDVLYMLDTNILSDMITNSAGRAAARLEAVGEASVLTSIIVAAEIRFGTAKRGSKRLTARAAAVLAAIEIEPFQSPADEHYARIRTNLEASGKPISANDMLIAAHALALQCTLVTANEREFARVPGLRVENWLR